MKKISTIAITTIILLISGIASADKPVGSAYIDGGASKTALILAHGRGKHPTWKVVEPLRKGVNEKLAYHTLSLQMPNEDKYWKEYANDFPVAYETIKKAIRFLKDEKGVSRIFLMGHSMGSRMASAFVAENPGQVDGLIVAGCWSNGEDPLSCKRNLERVHTPVLDLWGGGNNKDYEAVKEREGMVSEKFQQVEIPGANHKYDGYDSELVTAVVNWLKTQKSISKPTVPGMVQ